MERGVVKLLVTVCVLGGCGYDAPFANCTVRCSASTGCPSGFSCSITDGWCRRTGSVTPCPMDAQAPDAFDPSVCPATYTISLPSTTTRYRVAADGLDWMNANGACVADQTSPTGFTHLVVFADRQEGDVAGPLTVRHVMTRSLFKVSFLPH